MMEIIENVAMGLGIISIVRFGYLTVVELIPQYMELRKEEKMTVAERMALRKARGEI